MYQNYGQGGFGSHGDFAYGGSTAASSSFRHEAAPAPATTSSVSSRMNESAALALLNHLSKDDLQHLLDNDSKLQDLINDLDQVRGIQMDHDNLIATNKSLAEYNLSLQPRIAGLIQQVASGYSEINSLKTDLASDKATLDTYVGQQSLDTLHALLQTEAAKSEEEAEELAEKFCSQELDVEEFMTDYLPKRTFAHLRRIKTERLPELIRNSGSMSSGQSQSAPYPTGNNVVPPYPTSSFGMPQLPSMYTSQ